MKNTPPGKPRRVRVYDAESSIFRVTSRKQRM